LSTPRDSSLLRTDKFCIGWIPELIVSARTLVYHFLKGSAGRIQGPSGYLSSRYSMIGRLSVNVCPSMISAGTYPEGFVSFHSSVFYFPSKRFMALYSKSIPLI